jgi:hypothetical protein
MNLGLDAGVSLRDIQIAAPPRRPAHAVGRCCSAAGRSGLAWAEELLARRR